MFELEQVEVVLGGQSILSGVDLSIQSGTRTAIVGRSGSGKSTLLKLLSFLLHPRSGIVKFRGQQPQPGEITRIRRKVPLVHQEPVLWGETVDENLTQAYSYASADGSRAPDDGELAGLLEATGLEGGMLHGRADKLSGGEKQRVAVARALALRPDALLLDEPTSALDLLTAEKLFDSLTSSFPDLTVILVTHSPSLVERCDSQILLEDGRVRAMKSGVKADELRKFLETGE